MQAGMNIVIALPNKRVRDAVTAVIAGTSGQSILPARKSDSDSASRFHYDAMASEVIINYCSQTMQQTLGQHVAVIAIKVLDRHTAAKEALEILKEYGLTGEIHRRAQPEFPEDFIVFVTCPDFNGLALMFWPQDENVRDIIGAMTDEQRAALPARQAWSHADIQPE